MAVDIKHLSDYSDKLRNVSNIVTETVGTTTSYTFPEDTLHPYIKRNLKEYIISHWDDEEIQEMVKVLRKQAKAEVAEGWVGAITIPEGDDVDVKEVKEAVAEYALNQIDSSDLTSIKSRIVNDGYSKGKLQGHLFPDVLPAFKKWIAEGKKIFMYSSGLEMSQKNLVSKSVEGDITELISGCFYSSEFPRTRSESFREMCKKVDCSADKVAFLTDNAQTARAAHKAGLVVIMMCREGNSYMGNSVRESFPVIDSFEDISQHICGKRKMSEEPEDACGKKPKLDGSVTETEVKVEEITSPINIIVTPPEEKKEAGADDKKEKKEVEEEMEVDEKAEVEEKKPAEDKKEGVSTESEEKKDTSEVEKEESEVEAMETDGKVSGDKVAEQDKSEEKVEVEKSKESEVKVDGAKDKKEEKAEEVGEVAKDGAEEEKSEKDVEESKAEEKTEVETKEKEVAELKEDEKKESADEAKDSETEVKSEKSEETVEKKSEETVEKKSEETVEKESEETVEKKSEDTVEKKSEETVEKKNEEAKEKSGETIEEKKSEEAVTKEEKEEKSDESSEVKSAEEQSEEKKEGEDESKNNDEKSEVIKENGEAEKKVCTNGIDRAETKENGVSSDEKVEAVKAVPKKAELEVNEAAAQESA